MLKKLISAVMSICLIMIGLPQIKAEEKIIVEHFETHSYYHEFSQEELEGTKFEGKHVVTFDGVAYISSPLATGGSVKAVSITAIAAGVVIGWIIDGVFLAATGYTGPEVVARLILEVYDAGIDLGEDIASAYFNSSVTTLQKVRTRTGRDCVPATGGLWRCIMSETWSE